MYIIEGVLGEDGGYTCPTDTPHGPGITVVFDGKDFIVYEPGDTLPGQAQAQPEGA